MKPKKCILFQQEVEFLGRIVGQKGLQLTSGNIDAVINWPTPKNSTEVERFLGLVNYHRLFLKDLAKEAVPLYRITSKKTFVWGSEQEQAFKKIKELMITAPLLTLPNSKDPFILDTDASKQQLERNLYRSRTERNE